MFAMTGRATGQTHFLKTVLHSRVGEQFANLHVARTAGVRHGSDLWRQCSVISVAVIAGGCTSVPFRHGLGMHALFPVVDLRVADSLTVILAARHQLGIGVASAAGIRDVGGIDGRRQIVDRLDVVMTVTGDAGGNFRITGLSVFDRVHWSNKSLPGRSAARG